MGMEVAKAVPEFVSAPETRVSRFQSAGLEAAMEQFANPQALAAGLVCVIDLDTVVQRFGSRWPMRREHVHEHVTSTLDRQLGPTAYHLRISDTDVLICQPDKERLAGQALCLRALREILTHFLGDGEMADAGVHEVVRISPEGVEARRVDVRAAAAEADRQADKAGGGQQPSLPTSLGGANQWTPFVTAYGVGLQVTTRPEPIFQLREKRAIGLRLTNCVAHVRSGRQLRPPELARLTTADLLRIDVAGLLKGLEALRGDGQRRLTVIVPVTLSSLSHPAGRARIITGLQEAREHVDGGVICELRLIEGAPPAALAQAVAIVRPYCLLVVGNLDEPNIGLGRLLKGTGLNGVSTRVPQGLEGAAFIGWASAAIRSARQASKSVLLYGLSSEHAMSAAISLGATHGSRADWGTVLPTPAHAQVSSRAGTPSEVRARTPSM
ncbi:MAG: hypothetical protein U0987_11330 [Afipia sp.]|nr:hypothetical protein [Afipia sp.]